MVAGQQYFFGRGASECPVPTAPLASAHPLCLDLVAHLVDRGRENARVERNPSQRREGGGSVPFRLARKWRPVVTPLHPPRAGK